MGYNNTAKPDGWIFPYTGVLANAFLDSDLVAGNVSIDWFRADGPIIDSFTSGSSIVDLLRPVEVGNQSIVWRTWTSGAGTWSISGGAASWSGAGRGMAYIDPSPYDNSGERTVELTYTATSGTPILAIHSKDFQAARCLTLTVGGTMAVGSFTGSTTLTAGTHTVKAAVSNIQATTFDVALYLDGVLEGSTTLTKSGDASSIRVFGFGANTGGVGITFQHFRITELATLAATHFDVRSADGEVIVEASPMPADGSPILIADPDPYGWYHVLCYGPERGGSVDGDRGFHDEYGDIYFGRLPDRPALGVRAAAGTASTSYGNEWNDAAHGWLGIGAVRMSYLNTTLPTGAALYASAAGPTTYYVDNGSTNRPRYVTAQFAAGAAGQDATVTTIVNAAKTRVKVWEIYNEPHVRTTEEVATYISTYLAPTYAAIKAADPDAIVLAPANVDPDPNDYQFFVDGGGLDYCDGVSFHAYNLARVDIGRLRRLLGDLLDVLDEAGVARSQVWQTEQGGLTEWDGRLSPLEAAQAILSQIFAQELHGIPMEHNVLWYDQSHGFDNFPSWTFAHYDDGVTPLALAARNMAAELYDSTFVEEFDLGDDADMYMAGLWSFDDGTSVVGFMAEADTLPAMTFRLTGATGPLEFVDPWGNESTLTGTDGIYELDATPLLPVWVRIPAGGTVDLWARTRPTNYALVSAGASITSTGASQSNLTRAIDGAHYSIGGVGYDLPASSSGQQQTWTVDLGRSRDISRIATRIIGPTEFTIDTSTDGTTWTTRYTYDRAKVTVRYAGNHRCLWANYDPPATAHAADVETTARYVRVAVADAMWNDVYIPAFGSEEEANETYDADTSTWPVGYLVQVPWIRVYGPAPFDPDRPRFNMTVTCSG